MTNDASNPWLPQGATSGDGSPQGTPQGGSHPPRPAPPHPPSPHQPAGGQAPAQQPGIPAAQPWGDQQAWGQYPQPGPGGSQPWQAPPRKKRRAGLVVGILVGALLFLALAGAGVFFVMRGNEPAGQKLPAAKPELTGATARARSGAFEYGVPALSQDVTDRAMEGQSEESKQRGDLENARVTLSGNQLAVGSYKSKQLQEDGLSAQVETFCKEAADKSKGTSKRITDYQVAGGTAYGCQVDGDPAKGGEDGVTQMYLLGKNSSVYVLLVAAKGDSESAVKDQVTSSLATWKWR